MERDHARWSFFIGFMRSPLIIKSNREFNAVYRQGQRYRQGPLLLLLRKRHRPYGAKGPDRRPALRYQPRYAVTSSRKVRGAVQRVRCRRILRELIRQELPSLRPGYDFILLALDYAAPGCFSDWQKDFRSLLRSAAMYRTAALPARPETPQTPHA